MKALTGVALAAALVGMGCSQAPEAELRQYQVVVVGTDRQALQSAIGSTASNELVRPFQASGKCKPAIWLPKLSVITPQELLADVPKPTDLGFFDKTEFVKETQNAVQSALGQKPALSELDEAAVKRLAAYQLPATLTAASAETADYTQAARKLAGRQGVVLYKDDEAVAPKAEAQSPQTPQATQSPQAPVAFADAQAYRKQVHDLLCDLPADVGSAAPVVVLLGMAGKYSASGRPAVDSPAVVSTDITPVASTSAPRTSPPNANAQRAFDRGMTLVHQDKLELSLKEFTSAIEQHPAYPAAFANRGVANMKLKSYGRALDDLNKAIALEPTNPVWHYNLAAYYAVRQEPDRGLDALDQALKLGFARSDNVQIDALKLGPTADPDLAALRKRQAEYCAVLERHNKFLCK